jgi:hypothetical protein
MKQDLDNWVRSKKGANDFNGVDFLGDPMDKGSCMRGVLAVVVFIIIIATILWIATKI